jgi:type VI secretion system protein ImpH
MDSEKRIETDRLAFIDQLLRTPERFDFYIALRNVEALFPESPIIGQAKRPAIEAVRLGQSPLLSFAPASLSEADHSKAGKLRLMVRFFGLFGPQGALPLHLTELAHERDLNFGDATLRRFADIFHHRALSLFYMIWRQAQPTANRDRPRHDRYMEFLGAFVGYAADNNQRLDQLPAQSKRYFAGHLGRLAKTPDGLAAILSEFFSIPVEVKTFHARWINLEIEDQTNLSGAPELRCLGRGATLGRRVYDAQSSVELLLGPMSLKSYEAFLPTGRAIRSLNDWIKSYLGGEWFVQTRHLLLAKQVPKCQLGHYGKLGWTTWLGKRPEIEAAAADLRVSNYYS